MLACGENPFQRPPRDSPAVAQYRSGFAARMAYLRPAIADLLTCTSAATCNDAANRIDVAATGLGDFINPPNPTLPPVPTCLDKVQAHVLAAYDPLRRASHETFGYAPAPRGAIAEIEKARHELDAAATLLANVHC